MRCSVVVDVEDAEQRLLTALTGTPHPCAVVWLQVEHWAYWRSQLVVAWLISWQQTAAWLGGQNVRLWPADFTWSTP